MTKLLMSANTDWYLFNFRLSLAKYSRQQGFEVIFVSPPGKFVEEINQRGFRWIEWSLGRQTLNPWHEIRSLLDLAKIYRRERPDLVHHHTVKPVLYGSLIAGWMRVPGIVNSITGRGYIFLGKDRKASMLKLIVEPIYRIALNAPQCNTIFENETDEQYFVNNGLISGDHTWLIPSVGVDPDNFSPLTEPEGVPVILMAARMLWDKGVGVLVESARILKSKYPVRVVLVGEPDVGNPTTINVDTLSKWQQEGVIEWWKWRDDMPAIYNHSHIVTLPTMYGEGVPTTLLEAAACGRPLVASDIPGCRDVIEDGVNGYLIPPNDHYALAEALERLVNDPNSRRRMGLAGRQLILDKFSKHKVNAATFDVYQRSLATNKETSSLERD
jgi:glycosyltransferase involved in cell wall biosynthesis